ncbi:MAG: 30S ribosomal protein S10 [Mycoplasmataceae bacterium]|jgi:small subunit ribosomal protein S10|nr:30S ribosomal protein S10 [Mycoplasmataceae bacterium]
MKSELRIKLSSYDHDLLDKSVKKIIEIAKTNNCEFRGPVPLPTKKEVFTFCRSVHVDKPSMEQFERRTHKRLLILSNTSGEIMLALKKMILPSGVEIHVHI